MYHRAEYCACWATSCRSFAARDAINNGYGYIPPLALAYAYPMPLSRAPEADGWRHDSGLMSIRDAELVGGTVIERSHRVFDDLLETLAEADYAPGAHRASRRVAG